MNQSEPFPDMETGYNQYAGLYCDALSRLARQGFVVPPADTWDLIHDFIADAWEGLAERYDPACGPVAGYVYGAFVRFARQWVLRVQRWRPRLQDMACLADTASEAALSPLDAIVRDEEAELLREALAELPEESRTLLLDFFGSGPRSRRKLADKYHMSRYRAHELLINAFGQLVTRLAARGVWPSADREVAVALWCEGWGPEEAAARLGRPAQQVRETRDRLAKSLAAALGKRHGGAPLAPPAAVPGPTSS
jgi:RNA polymerase sigma factor (sigma-70 family)